MTASLQHYVALTQTCDTTLKLCHVKFEKLEGMTHWGHVFQQRWVHYYMNKM